MPDVADAIQEAIGEVFDTLRDGVLLDPTDTLTLLTASPNANEFDTFFEIHGKWLAIKQGKRIEVKIAANTSDITETMLGSTHFRFNDDVYVISESEPTAPDTAGHFLWTFTGDKRASRSNFVEMW